MRDIELVMIGVVPLLVMVIGVVIADGNPDPPRPPTCIEGRGPATDPAEHEWSMECYRVSMQAESWGTFSWFQEQCIESACIAFRGLP